MHSKASNLLTKIFATQVAPVAPDLAALSSPRRSIIHIVRLSDSKQDVITTVLAKRHSVKLIALGDLLDKLRTESLFGSDNAWQLSAASVKIRAG